MKFVRCMGNKNVSKKHGHHLPLMRNTRSQTSSVLKVCLLQHINETMPFPAKNDCESETLYPVHLYKKMTKNIISQIPGLNSKVACLAECVDNKDCKVIYLSRIVTVSKFQAVSYKNGMCVLHSASPAEDYSLLSEGSGKTMVIENGCHVSNRQKTDQVKKLDGEQLIWFSFHCIPSASEQSESSWQEWSLCQYGVKGKKMRVRQRECDDCDEDMQVEEC